MIDAKPLRKQMKARRAGLSVQEQKRYSAQACRKIQSSRAFRAAKHIAIYLPVRGEISPLSLMQGTMGQRKQFYLPVLAPYHKDGLIFIRWHKQTRFRMNRFKIKEPLLTTKGRLAKRSLDLVIVPLLAFDHLGSRLGMGGGFYDRTFAFRRQSRHSNNNRPLLMGLAYHFQQAERLQRQSWDVSLDAAATNQALQNFARQHR